MITSDNGAEIACYNGEDYAHKSCGELRGYKADIWDGGHREPFIARWPGVIKPSSISNQLICLSDLFATFAELFNEPLLENAAEDSISFLSELNQTDGLYKRNAIVHHSGNGMFSIRKGYWKLIDGVGSGGFFTFKPSVIKDFIKNTLHLNRPGQLYNLKEDLQEQNNLWKEHPEKVKELLLLLDKAKKQERTREIFVQKKLK
jgi:arylsulfatase A-like enzyme